MTPEEFASEFYFDPSTPRAVGYATNLSIVREIGAQAVSVAAELLHRETKQPSNKLIWLQMQPPDAMALCAAILVLAKKERWPIRPDFLEMVQAISLVPKDRQN